MQANYLYFSIIVHFYRYFSWFYCNFVVVVFAHALYYYFYLCFDNVTDTIMKKEMALLQGVVRENQKDHSLQRIGNAVGNIGKSVQARQSNNVATKYSTSIK